MSNTVHLESSDSGARLSLDYPAVLIFTRLMRGRIAFAGQWPPGFALAAKAGPAMAGSLITTHARTTP